MRKLCLLITLLLINLNFLFCEENAIELMSWENYILNHSNAEILDNTEDAIIIEVDGKLYKVILAN